ncbi:MAG: DUF6427 family protein, partial [Bacteroidales bacterium]|nr:DUF6427 family protein [Bacteroidales bacterium]
IKLLKSNTPANYVLMFAIMLVLWAFKFIFMPTAIENFESYNLFFNSFPETIFYKYFSTILGFLAVFFFALILNKTNSDLLIVKSAYQSPGVFFILLSGTYINSQRMTPILLSAILLFLSILILMYSYQKFKAFDNGFNSGLVFSLGVLIFPKLIFFFPFLIFTLFYIKPIQWRELVVFFMGILTPLIMYISIVWLYGNINPLFSKLDVIFSQIFSSGKYSLFYSLVLLPPIIWGILSIIAKYYFKTSNKISTRKFQNLIVIFIPYFVILFFSPIIENEAIVFLYAPLSLLFSNIIISAEQKVGSFFLFGIIVTLCLSQFFQISFYLSVF